MKKTLYKAALLAALGLAGVTAVQAQTTDMLLGFNDALGPVSAQNDYVIDLGTDGSGLIADAISNGGTYDLSSLFNTSTFTTAFESDASALNNVAVGVVGGGLFSTHKELWQTYLPGQTLSNPSTGSFGQAYANAEVSDVGEYASSSQSGWTWNVAASATEAGDNITGDDVAAQTANPMGTLNSGALSLTLWENTEPNGLGGKPVGWVDQGTFNFDLTTDTITFTVVPEPSACYILAGAGLLVLSLRRQFVRKNS